MSMIKEVIRKFVEEDFKDFAILVISDNEHRFYHRAKSNPDIVWDWDNDVFYALETNEELIDQNGHPMQVTVVALEEIQFMTAFIDTKKTLEFINSKYTEDVEKEKAKQVLQVIKPGFMGPKTLRKTLNVDEYLNNQKL